MNDKVSNESDDLGEIKCVSAISQVALNTLLFTVSNLKES